MRNLWFQLMAFAATCPFIFGCGDKPITSVQNQADLAPKQGGSPPIGAATPKNEDLGAAKPDVAVGAKDLYAEWQMNTGSFDNKYREKLIEVTGVVEDFEYSFQKDDGYLMLDSPSNKFYCKEPHPMSRALPGQTVTLRTRFTPGMGLGFWTISRVQGEKPLSFTAEQLAKDIAADPKGVANKIKGKFMVITGMVQKADKEDYTVSLTAPEKQPRIRASLGVSNWRIPDEHKWLQAGQPISVLGKSISGDGELSSAVVLPPTKAP